MHGGELPAEVSVGILEALPFGLSYFDADGRLVYANPLSLAYAGLSMEEARGRPIFELVEQEAVELYREIVPSVLAGEQRSYARSRADAEGRETQIEVQLLPRVVEGRVHGFLAMGWDITERMQSERALHEAARQVTLLQERQRVAEDLHDLVIQRLFAAGLDLAAASRGGPDAAARVESAAVAVDKAIRELRGTIHELRELMTPAEVPHRVERIVEDGARVLGFRPRLTVAGAWHDVPQEVLSEMTAVLNEALSNIARHADASEVQVTVVREGGMVLLRVADDGRGVDPEVVRSSGVANMRSRAERLGGRFRLKPNEPHGTVAEWRVPVGG